MSQQNMNGIKEFVAGAAIAQYQLVKIDSDLLAQVCAEGDTAHGIAAIAADSGKPVSVILRNRPGTRKVIAAGAFAVAASLYVQTGGKVDDAAHGTAQFLALEAATADGDIIEALPLT